MIRSDGVVKLMDFDQRAHTITLRRIVATLPRYAVVGTEIPHAKIESVIDLPFESELDEEATWQVIRVVTDPREYRRWRKWLAKYERYRRALQRYEPWRSRRIDVHGQHRALVEVAITIGLHNR